MTAKSRAAHAAPAMAAQPAASLPTPSPVPPARPAAAPPSAPPAPQRTSMGPSASHLLCGLFERAQPALTDEDLSDLVMHGETATHLVGGLATLCMDLGSLMTVEADDTLPSHARSGVLQRPEDVAQLLFLLSNVADQAHGLQQLASMADSVRAVHGGRV